MGRSWVWTFQSSPSETCQGTALSGMSRPDSAHPMLIFYTPHVPSIIFHPSSSKYETTQREKLWIANQYQSNVSFKVSDTRWSEKFTPSQCKSCSSTLTSHCCPCTPSSHRNYSWWDTEYPSCHYTCTGTTTLPFLAAQSHSNVRTAPGFAAPHSISHYPYPPYTDYGWWYPSRTMQQ